ncbi:MAG: PD-(D/E)XK nuclease family protein [Candidatus Aminicenantes bacterium]|nr:PD-(D/E)XK nuclease family protein [Candidatus Aminicenantes bacterium]
MRIELVSPKDDLIAAVASCLDREGKDYSRTWVVFPEKRPAYYLRKTLSGAEKTGFIPPRIDSLDAFVDEIYTARLGLHDRPVDVLDAVALLFEIHRAAPRPFGGGHFMTADHFFPLGTKLFRDLEELNAATVGRDDLVRLDHWTDESLPPKTAQNLQALSFFYDHFYSTLTARGYSTASMRHRQVLDRIEPEMFADIDAFVFAGFFALTKTEGDLLKRILSWDKSRLFLMKGRGGAALLDQWGVGDASLRKEIEDPGPVPPLTFIKSADTHGQIFALNKVLEGTLREPKLMNETQVIVLPAAETLFPLYQQTLSKLSEADFNISLGYPLSRTPIYSFFDKLLELIQTKDDDGRIYAPNYLRFVLHPYAKNVYFPGPEKRADLTRILFHAIEEELTRRRTKSFWSVAELETDTAIRDRVQDLVRNLENAPVVAAFAEHLRSIHAHTLDLFTQIKNVGDFAEKLGRVLTYIYENSTARLHYFFHPYAEAFLSRLDALSRSLLRETVFDDPMSYFNLFRRVISAGSVPFFGTPLRGLQVLGFWETRGIPFKDVYILDTNEEILPPNRRADSLLPFAARAALKLPTYRDQEVRMEYYLDTLIRGAAKVYFFFVENKERERSRFVEKLIWERQKREREPRAGSYVKTVRYNVALQTEEPRPAVKTGAVMDFLRRFTYSATSLDMYLRCPLRFYHAYVLNLREREEVGEGLDRKDIGTFVHSILEEYFRKFAGRRLRAADLNAHELEALIDRRFDEFFGGDAAGTVYLMRLQVRRHLRDFLSDYQIPIIQDLETKGKHLRLLSLEKRLWAERMADNTPLKITAKVDRIESRGDDVYILDYKTSASTKYLGIKFNKLDFAVRESWAQAVSSLQIPLYHWIYARTSEVLPARIQARFLMLGKNSLGPSSEYSPYEKDDDDIRGEQIKTMDRFIDELLIEIIDPRIPFAPCRNLGGVCEDCPYAYLCNRK